MKGLGIKREEFQAILDDPKWAPFLVFDKERNVFVDLKRYSENKCYLPVKSEYQDYVAGFFITKKLYECVYRSQNDLVCIYPEDSDLPKISGDK